MCKPLVASFAYTTLTLTTKYEYLASQICFRSHAAVVVILVQVKRHSAMICKKPNDFTFHSWWEGGCPM